MNSTTIHALQTVKNASRSLLQLPSQKTHDVLNTLADALTTHTETILQANQTDLQQMDKADPRFDRLLLTKSRIQQIAQDVKNIAQLPSPLNINLSQTILPNGLRLTKVSVPIGVIAVIFEARPNVLIDVFSLCFKSGNACVLKGGKEAQASNLVLFTLVQQALAKHDVPTDIVYLMPAAHDAVHDLLHAVGLVDVCIPRGSQGLIQFTRQHARIPVIETGAGIVHTYFDASGDVVKGANIINNAKTRRVSVCNALDCLVIHRQRLTDLPQLVTSLAAHNVIIFADGLSYAALEAHYPNHLLNVATAEVFGKEFLDYKLAIKAVDSLENAIQHISQFTSGHSEAIIAEDKSAINTFLKQIDAAAVYANTSTAFTDGAQFGLGAEIGISTQKLHARGPMGLMELTSYKWIIRGDGQIRG
ncbi:MAG: glutamate-5-semialdehyde dehydrogenase [Gammaproteobacteria bacterium]